jgi:uncharacterized membrane protein
MATYLILLLILSGIGIINTLYLSYHSIKKTPVKCFFFPDEWCLKVQQSTYSRIFLGIPNSFLGLGMYSTIFILGLLYSQNFIGFTPIAAVIAVGFLFSLYFIYIQAFVLRAFCTWCVVSAIDFVILAILVLNYYAII